MNRRKLPIGIETFREIREDDCYYVDKTRFIAQLAKEGKHYFLSRPRRFGKSLFVDTCKSLFEGHKELFDGLDVQDEWDWSVRYPVVRLNFVGGNFTEPQRLHTNLMAQLEAIGTDAGVPKQFDTAPEQLRHLLKRMYQQSGQRVVFLVDEYDLPILDALKTPDIARANREFLRSIYSVVKSEDAFIKFSFITGVSRFSKVSLFSTLSNLIDITLDRHYSALCGYTEGDLEKVFAPELPGLDRDQIRKWYNGYGWLGEERVYNPFDILLFFRNREFDAYWFETGTPAFLVETLVKRGISTIDLSHMMGSTRLLGDFDVDRIAPEALLFQTGYLTIGYREVLGSDIMYHLTYPNQEVRQSLNESMLQFLLGSEESYDSHKHRRLGDLLLANDWEGMESLFRALYAGIPSDWYRRNDISRYEGHYASVFYSCFASLGLDVWPEDASSHGRVDMTVLFNANVYLFEFKMVETNATGEALAQLERTGYADKYRARGEPIHLIGVEFSRKSRNIVSFERKML